MEHRKRRHLVFVSFSRWNQSIKQSKVYVQLLSNDCYQSPEFDVVTRPTTEIKLNLNQREGNSDFITLLSLDRCTSLQNSSLRPVGLEF